MPDPRGPLVGPLGLGPSGRLAEDDPDLMSIVRTTRHTNALGAGALADLGAAGALTGRAGRRLDTGFGDIQPIFEMDGWL